MPFSKQNPLFRHAHVVMKHFRFAPSLNDLQKEEWVNEATMQQS